MARCPTIHSGRLAPNNLAHNSKHESADKNISSTGQNKTRIGTIGNNNQVTINQSNFEQARLGDRYIEYVVDISRPQRVIPETTVKVRGIVGVLATVAIFVTGWGGPELEYHGHTLPERSLRLAFSGDEGETRRLLPSVLDRFNRTVATLTRTGGHYMLVAGYPGSAAN